MDKEPLVTFLYEINVTLSKYQKRKIRNAFIKGKDTRVKLKNKDLTGNDTLLVPHSTFQSILDEFREENEEFKEFFEGYPMPFHSIVEELEEKRSTGKGLLVDLGYSVITGPIKDSVANNIKKLFSNKING